MQLLQCPWWAKRQSYQLWFLMVWRQAEQSATELCNILDLTQQVLSDNMDNEIFSLVGNTGLPLSPLPSNSHSSCRRIRNIGMRVEFDMLYHYHFPQCESKHLRAFLPVWRVTVQMPPQERRMIQTHWSQSNRTAVWCKELQRSCCCEPWKHHIWPLWWERCHQQLQRMTQTLALWR